MSFRSPLYPPTPISSLSNLDISPVVATKFSTEPDPIPQNLSPSTPYIPKRLLLMAFSRSEHRCIFETRSCTLFSIGLNIGAYYVLGIRDQEGSVKRRCGFFRFFPLFYFYFYFLRFFLFSFNSKLKKEKKKKSKTVSFQAYLMAALIGL